MSKQVLTAQQRHDIFQNDGTIQMWAQRVQSSADEYDRLGTAAALGKHQKALAVYNLLVKQLNERMDAGFTY